MESIIPYDIQEDILIRLPLKSLLACILMCKKWKTMICSELFKTRYVLLSMTIPKVDSTPKSLFHSVCLLRPRRYKVSAPIRGWICVQSSSKLRLYNPITNKILRLPVLVGRGQLFPHTCRFGYDEANGVFKVLGSINSSFVVYTVRPGGEGSWRPIPCEHPHTYRAPFTYTNLDADPPLSVTNALCKGGVLYYAAETLPGLAPTIMSFDLSSETFDYNPLPEGFVVDDGSTMVNYNGKVALVNNSAVELQNTGGFQICVRNEDSGQWVSERVEIPGWTDGWPRSLYSFVGTIGSAGPLVFRAISLLTNLESVFYYKQGTGITRVFFLEEANKGAYHYVRACLHHFECLLHTT